MRENFSIEEILEAVNRLLNTKVKETLLKKNKLEKSKNDILPTDTEKIILQAEGYIKKKIILLF